MITPDLTDDALLSFVREHLASGEHVQITATEPFMTPQQMADSLNVSRSFIMSKITAGEIVSVKRGTRHRISVAEVERYRRQYLDLSAELLAQDF